MYRTIEDQGAVNLLDWIGFSGFFQRSSTSLYRNTLICHFACVFSISKPSYTPWSFVFKSFLGAILAVVLSKRDQGLAV